MDWLMRRLGDIDSDFFGGCQQLTTPAMRAFNQLVPPPEDVYCQSYATSLKHARDDLIMAIPYLIVRRIEGANDGLVTPEAAAFCNFKGTLQVSPSRGISHREVIDGRRKPFVRTQSHAPKVANAENVETVANSDSIDDMPVWYCTLVGNLKVCGY
jgi:triacylglycerol lipase